MKKGNSFTIISNEINEFSAPKMIGVSLVETISTFMIGKILHIYLIFFYLYVSNEKIALLSFYIISIKSKKKNGFAINYSLKWKTIKFYSWHI